MKLRNVPVFWLHVCGSLGPFSVMSSCVGQHLVGERSSMGQGCAQRPTWQTGAQQLLVGLIKMTGGGILASQDSHIRDRTLTPPPSIFPSLRNVTQSLREKPRSHPGFLFPFPTSSVHQQVCRIHLQIKSQIRPLLTSRSITTCRSDFMHLSYLKGLLELFPLSLHSHPLEVILPTAARVIFPHCKLDHTIPLLNTL